jgi:TonB family protein
MRARTSANEAAAIGDIRTIISAETAFEGTGGGGYADLGCLAEPKGCIAGYGGPQFLDAGLAGATEKSGYKRVFHAGPAVAAARRYNTFAYTATPSTPGQTGTRSFCGDASGLVCADPSGAEIVPQDGACPRTCPALGETVAPPALRLPPSTNVGPTPRSPTAVRTLPPARAPAPRATARAVPEAPAPAQTVRVGGTIREPRKLKHVNPVYPAIAKQAHTEGVVILECSISPQGRVTEVRVLRGIPLLDQAAIDAVRQWEYEPTLLDGVPVPVINTVTVNFKLR